MVEVEQLLPEATTVDAARLVPKLRDARAGFRPFDDRVVACVSDLARALRVDPLCRRVPAIAALAFWIRPASIERFRADCEAIAQRDPSVMVAPRGVVFHLPPSNVDTIFVYSWLMAALSGNANVVRISSSAEGDSLIVLKVIEQVIKHHPEVARTMSFVRYGHQETITAALSAADVRVIWGGDETVTAVRRVPLDPLSIEVTFADRYSMSLFDAAAVAELDDEALVELVRHFYNDSYWFDQLGCSSPRLVFWRGSDAETVGAQHRFLAALRERIALEGYASPTGAVMNKLVRSAAMASDGAADAVVWDNPNVTVVTQPGDAPIVRTSPGAGMFAFRRIEVLEEIVPLVERRDQTLSHFGIAQKDLEFLVAELNGRGIDRVVPVGAALQFGRYWDGWDLLDVYTRRTFLEVGPRPGQES